MNESDLETGGGRMRDGGPKYFEVVYVNQANGLK